MKKILLFIVLVFCSLFFCYEPHPEYDNISENIVYIDATFDFYDYRESHSKNGTTVISDSFIFLDHNPLRISVWNIDDKRTFKETFLNMKSGTKMHIAYLTTTNEIIELLVNDTYYISLDKSIKSMENADKASLFFSLLVSPLILVGFYFILLLVDIPQD